MAPAKLPADYAAVGVVHSSSSTGIVHSSSDAVHSSTVTSKDPFIGGSPIVSIKIQGFGCDCIADTGSQISTVQLDFFNQKIKPILDSANSDRDSRIFNVRAANGMTLPYTSYFIADVTFKDSFIPDCGFLVVPSKSKRSDVLLGTNILEKIPRYAEHLSSMGIAPNCSRSEEQSTRTQESTGPKTCGFARVNVPGGLTVDAYSVTYVPLRAKANITAEFEPLPNLNLDLMIPNVFTSQSIFVVPVLNLSSFDVELKNNTRLGILHTAEKVPKNITLHCDAGEIVVSTADVAFNGTIDAAPIDVSQPETTSDKLEEEIRKVTEDFPGTREELQTFIDLMRQYRHVFSASDTDLGCVDIVKHRIPTTDDVPVILPYRRIPPALLKEVKDHLELLGRQGIIRESSSNYASPIVLVRKKDGRLRMCCDFRALNSKTIRDAHPLPRIQESLDSLNGSKFFSSLDLKSAYNQISVHEDDIPKTAFTTPFGLYEHLRMPFGLKNAPACFQRLMNTVFSKELFDILLCYLDDILVYAGSIADHLDRLRIVFERLSTHNLKLELKKCSFFKTSVTYLGYQISQDGISTEPSKIQVLRMWPSPTTLRELRTFLGFTSFYRRYVSHYTQKAKPLHKLVAELNKLYPKKRRKPVELGDKWTPECQDAFQIIIDALTTAPTLAYPRYGEYFILETDSSESGLGAVLYQLQDGKKRIIAYASRGLRKGEANRSNYSSKKLELLALKWACEHFRDILVGSRFTIFTDNNPLSHILTTKRLSALEQRWINTLSMFDFEIKFRSGATNIGADTLSRIAHHAEPDMNSDDVDSCLLTAVQVTPLPAKLRKEIAEFAMDNVEVDEVDAPSTPASSLPTIASKDMARLQQEDDLIKRLVHYRSIDRRPNFRERQEEEKSTLALIRQWDRIVTNEEGTLFRKITDNHGDSIYQLLLPSCLKNDVLQALHDDAGHQALERTEQLIRSRCYWPTMSKDIDNYIKKCYRCNQAKMPYHQLRTPLGRLVASKPLECVAVDFTILEPSSDGRENVLVITDVFTKYTVAIPCKNQKAPTVAKALCHEWFFCYGIPLRLHSDKGRNFESHVIKELCKLFGIKKSSTTPYHPESNAICERFNRTLHNLLCTLEHDKKRQWAKYLPELVHSYNTTTHSSTGHSPFYLMFGRDCRLPIDLVLGTRQDLDDNEYNEEWVSTQRERLATAYKLAHEQMTKEADRRKAMHDQKAKTHLLTPGQRVFLRKRVIGRNKIGDAWGTRVYQVQSRQGNNDVYTVAPSDGFGLSKTVNRRDIRVCESPDWTPTLPPSQPRRISDVPSNSKDTDSDSSEDVTAKLIDNNQPNASDTDSDSDDGETDTDTEQSVQPTPESPTSVPSVRLPPPRPAPRVSTRENKGCNSNPYNQPCSAVPHLYRRAERW